MPTNWHRLFGLMLTDFFTNSPFVVELERDLSLKKQLLDIVVLRRGEGQFAGQLPDGFEDLAAHNLITFKSHRQALDDWALKELTGHYVNYRKQLASAEEPLLPEDQFRLYAVCARYPENLEGGLQLVRQGVFQCRRGTDVIRIIVASQVPHAEQNAMLNLFSAARADLDYGATHYHQRSAGTSTLLDQLLAAYRGEGLNLSYTMEDFRHDYLKEHVNELTPEERLEGLSPEQRLQGLPPEERLQGLSPEVVENVLKKLKAERKSPTRKAHRKK